MSDKKNLKNERDEELERFLKEADRKVEFPGNKEVDFTSREYDNFMEEERKHREKDIYEKLCSIAEKIVKIEPDEKKKRELQRAINFAYMEITPSGAYSFAILFGISLVILSVLLLVVGITGITFTLFLSFLGIGSIYLLMQYPMSRAALFRIKASNEIVLAVIYIVIYMRSAPNLEGAIRFAAEHLRGPLSLDFKKLLWDIETSNYTSIKVALSDYLEKWEENRSFIEAVQIIQNSLEQSHEKRLTMLDEAVSKMMSGSEEKMRKYSNSLELPIMVIHALGIMLPIMVLVMFPLILLILHETVKPVFLFIGYDILLPVVIYFTSTWTLKHRPMGLSTADISSHPEYEEQGKMKIGGKKVPIWPVSALIAACVIIPGFLLNRTFGASIFSKLGTSLIVTVGIGLGPASYFYFDTRKKLGIRKRVRSLESEFSEALFTFGNRLSIGEPAEKAMETTVQKNKELRISNLFRTAINNMREGGMNLRESLFDKQYGAVWQYPSKMMASVFRVVINSTRKSFKIGSITAISISKYLKKMGRVEENLKDMLSSETSSMKFLGSVLGPLVAGVSVAMAGMMIRIFTELGKSMQEIQGGGGGIGGMGGMGMQSMMLGGWGSVADVMSVSSIQVIVGVYVIETAYLLASLTSGIENGPGDVVAKRHEAAVTILIAVLVYAFTTMIAWQVFGSQVKGLLSSGIA